MNFTHLIYIILFLLIWNCHKQDYLILKQEIHFKNIVQLTFGGNNAEGYFSRDDSFITFQSDSKKLQQRAGIQKQKYCDQIFLLKLNQFNFNSIFHRDYELISNGKGITTCSFFIDKDKILFASTHHNLNECPDIIRFYEGKYVWQLHDYDIYIADIHKKEIKKLISSPGYDAEATVSSDGRYIVYTSNKSGDLELWRYDIKTGKEIQLTHELGYDGGAFFSIDSQKIVWRASRPKTKEEIQNYKKLLQKNLVQPTSLNIFIMNWDGSNKKQITNLPGANWSPYFYPDGNKIIFSSNHHTLHKGGKIFNLFMINIDGSNIEQITFGDEFESFPFFSYYKHNGHYWLLFASNRNNKEKGETNLFIANWID